MDADSDVLRGAMAAALDCATSIDGSLRTGRLRAWRWPREPRKRCAAARHVLAGPARPPGRRCEPGCGAHLLRRLEDGEKIAYRLRAILGSQALTRTSPVGPAGIEPATEGL